MTTTRKLQILQLEDDILDAELIQKTLERSGMLFHAQIVSDKAEFSTAITEKTFDVILADHSMPQFSSVDALELAKTQQINTPFILVTGTVSEEFAVSILQRGADDYLLKHNLQRLPSAIYQAIEKKQVLEEKKAAQENLVQSNEEIRRLISHLQVIREEERTIIAREIHDELGQMLTVLKINMSMMRSHIPGEEKKLHEEIDELIRMTVEIANTVRQIASKLRPGILDDMGLGAALEWQSREFKKNTGIPCAFSEEYTDTVETNTATGLFRIFQETLTNIAKHSGATQVSSSLKQIDGCLVLSISDNGNGFDPTTVRSKKTLGLVGMKERAALMNAALVVDSSPGKGCNITVKLKS